MMWTSILCLLLAGAVSAAPLSPFFNYLPHYGSPKQGNNGGFQGIPSQPGLNAPISMEIIFPPRFPTNPAGGKAGTSSFPTQAFIKYSLPKAPGRKSVEIFYPYDFSQHQDQPNVPLIPQFPNIFPFHFMPQTVPQQPPMNPPFQEEQTQDPQQQTQPEQQAQTGEVSNKP
ncbi:secretory calcium-binding phosphoprotein 5 [Pimephales promelas]|uniref:secretory calcium-binding phosphoprotein 5 n=1 Tax=Pimephales promelas TaxID=90988 RepID=UPI001955BBD8|nr:secretory calcium-binding phosphoprotein 5 [Pimephales promelas]